MIICICKNISDTVIRNAICNGCPTLEELQIELGVCVRCESCRDSIEKIISMRKKVDKLSNYELLDNYKSAVKYAHYDPCGDLKPLYELDKLEKEILIRMNNLPI
jgi:bacterioferritin-associated ferredoxin